MAVFSFAKKAIAYYGELQCSVYVNNGKISVRANYPISVNVKKYIEEMYKKGSALADIVKAAVKDEYLSQHQVHGDFARVYGSHMRTSDGVILN